MRKPARGKRRAIGTRGQSEGKRVSSWRQCSASFPVFSENTERSSSAKSAVAPGSSHGWCLQLLLHPVILHIPDHHLIGSLGAPAHGRLRVRVGWVLGAVVEPPGHF